MSESFLFTNAARDVLAERERQRQKWGDAHDDQHKNDALAYGAVDYLLPGQAPMPASWAYKSKVTDREPRRDQLVKGAALALAAIEQYDRAGAKPKWEPCRHCTTRDYCINHLRGCDRSESLEAGIAPLSASTDGVRANPEAPQPGRNEGGA